MILVVKGLVVWLDQPVQEVVDPRVEVIVDPVMTGDSLREIILSCRKWLFLTFFRWSYEQSSRAGAGANDTPLNKLQYKYWVTKSKVVRKLGREEDECVVASDAELDAKLELYKSIHETTKDLSSILDQYNDRLCSKLNIYVKSIIWGTVWKSTVKRNHA